MNDVSAGTGNHGLSAATAARIEREIARVEGQALRLASPCGDGDMVWRAFGHTGPAVVLLHGGYGSWLHWIRNVEDLARDHRIFCADLPGLGDSDPAPPGSTGAELAAIVSAGIDVVVPGDTPFHLAGFSFGGVLSGDVAIRQSRRIRSLTLVGANGLGLRRGPMEPLQRATRDLSPAAVAAVHRRNLGLLMLAEPASVDDMAVALQVRNVARARTKSRPVSATDMLRRALEASDVPLAGIWGERDATSGPYLADREALLRSVRPEVDFRVIPAAGHWVQFESPGAFNAALRETIAGFERRAGA